ncbi:MAG: 3-oxoacyl-[acyl-carrier-protein] reductase [Chloroflexi bacterium]|nr:3-oxoacyl-[acyl-carrier-protein] reductase [Chloroflexota bacterium]
MLESDIKGKFALVTGAAKGIGRSSALRLAEQGVNVAVNYNRSLKEAKDVVAEIKDLGSDGFAVQADVGKPDQVKTMIDAVNDRFGQIDILVNNAGIIDDTLIMRMSDEQWRRVIETNLDGTFYCSRGVVRSMIKQRWGRIINIGSIVGSHGNPGQTNYSASKAGIEGFTKALAKELANRSVTVNVVTPGYIITETVEVLGPQFREKMLSMIPMGYLGDPDDIGHIVAYLASEKARYITGQVIAVDGGMAV